MTREPEDGDWAPLPMESVETPEARAAAVQRSRSVAMPKPALQPKKPRHKSENPSTSTSTAAAEQALQALRERLQRQEAASDPIAQAFRRASRRNADPIVDAPPRAVAPPPAPDACVDCSSDLHFDDRDAREGLPWFQALPVQEQQRLREEWRANKERFTCLGEQRRATVRRAMAIGALIACASVLMTGLGLAVAGGASMHLWPVWIVVTSVVAAALGARSGGGRIALYSLGMAAYALAMGRMIYLCPNLLFAMFLHGALFQYIGADLDLMRSGGFFGTRRIARVPTRSLRETARENCGPNDATPPQR